MGRSRSRSRSPYQRRSRSPRGERNPEDRMEIPLDDSEVAYLLGRGGQTKQRLANFSGAMLEFGGNNEDKVGQIWGNEKQRELAKLAIDITLQQRKNGSVHVDFDELESRKDCSSLEVPLSCVGFVLGAKGNTLRSLETKSKTFMFFDNDNVRDDKKRLYVLGEDRNREEAVKECEDVIRFKMTGQSNRGPPRDRRDRSPRRRSYSPRRRRSPSPYRSRDSRRDRYDDRRDRDRSPRRSSDRYDDRRRDDRRDDGGRDRRDDRFDDRYDGGR
eukprot:TRINITY_DN19658_c0_g1_i1.p1 TRINITY_DN19658_c0_g1~~TRINITY_DN19658_c0_g1_i1.p1  ORF type:complete len:272 (+),score=38.04 TRINITY_DN19658_c0_g1_i1:203-1018(+)